MLDQALDAAEAVGEREDLDALQEARRLGEPALELDRHHAAMAMHLAARQRVLRVIGEARVMHARDLLLAGEMLGDRLGVGAMPLHAQRQRLQAAQREEAVEGAGAGGPRVWQEG